MGEPKPTMVDGELLEEAETLGLDIKALLDDELRRRIGRKRMANEWAEKNRDLVVRFLRALQRGRDFMNTDRDECAKIAAIELRTTIDLAARALGDTEKLGILDPQLSINERGMNRVFDTLQKSGDIAADQKYDLKKFTDLSFWQASKQKK